MSYFVCGNVSTTAASPDAHVRLAYRASAKALELGLYVQFAHNIVQKHLAEILGQYDRECCSIPFLLTDSPLSDTSDVLVSPYVLIGEKGDEAFRQNAIRISIFIERLFDDTDVQCVALYIVDAIDVHYPTKTIAPTQLKNELLQAWKHRYQEGQDFNFRLLVSSRPLAGFRV